MYEILALWILGMLPVGIVRYWFARRAEPVLLAEDVVRRMPVWLALSDLFLDTDVLLFGENIHRALERSGYSRAEVLAILEWEVAPAVGLNLFSVAGEWAGFDPDWLRDRIVSQKRPLSWWRWFEGLLVLPVVRADLRKIERAYGRLP